MRCFLMCLAFMGFASSSLSQTVDGPNSIVLIATIDGSFEGAKDVSAKTDADTLAALEQQRWRELRYDVLQDLILDITLDQTPVDEAVSKARFSIHVSTDGERFQRIENKSLIAKDSFVSILIAQATVQGDDDKVTFLPSDWKLTISARPVTDNSATLLRPTVGTRALGCTQIGCGEFEALGDTPNVAGSIDLSQSTELPGVPEQSARSLNADETARELQTELARVGCYSGAIDGLWGPASRKAMGAFNRQNSSDAPVQTATPKGLVAVARVADVVCTGDE